MFSFLGFLYVIQSPEFPWCKLIHLANGYTYILLLKWYSARYADQVQKEKTTFCSWFSWRWTVRCYHEYHVATVRSLSLCSSLARSFLIILLLNVVNCNPKQWLNNTNEQWIAQNYRRTHMFNLQEHAPLPVQVNNVK